MSEISEKRDALIARSGPWTAHCIHLGDNAYTFPEPHWDSRLRRFLQIAADLVGQPLHSIRVADLGCLEAAYGIEFALHGAEVVAIEGRRANLEKSQFTKEALSTTKLELVEDDVRNFTEDKYGKFDLILCLGLLYHLDTPDVMDFVENMYAACSRIAIIDTHISLEGKSSYIWNGHEYFGSRYTEHETEAEAEQDPKLWHSLKNIQSFSFTLPSLCNLLRHVGFTSVYECLNPHEYHNPDWPRLAGADRHVVWKDRVTLVAIKGQKESLLSSPITQALPEIDKPESPEYFQLGNLPGVAGARPRWVRKLASLLPANIKEQLAKAIRNRE